MGKDNLRVVGDSGDSGDSGDPGDCCIYVLRQLRSRLAIEACADMQEFDRSKDGGSEFQNVAMERMKDTAWRLADVHIAIVEDEKIRIWERVAGSIISEIGVVGRKMEAMPALLEKLLSRFER